MPKLEDGVLVDQLCGRKAAEPFRELIGPRRAAVLLRSSGSADGSVDATWRVRLNVDTEPEDTSA